MATREAHTDVTTENGSTRMPDPQPEAETNAEAGQNNVSQDNSKDKKQDDSEKKPSDSSGDKAKKDDKKPSDSSGDQAKKDDKKPPGGFDASTIPPAPSGYTIKITIHR